MNVNPPTPETPYWTIEREMGLIIATGNIRADYQDKKKKGKPTSPNVEKLLGSHLKKYLEENDKE